MKKPARDRDQETGIIKPKQQESTKAPERRSSGDVRFDDAMRNALKKGKPKNV
jgi:hypothetical protein